MYKDLVAEEEKEEGNEEGGNIAGNESASEGTRGSGGDEKESEGEKEEKESEREQTPMRLPLTTMPQHHHKLPFQPPSPRLPSIGVKAITEPTSEDPVAEEAAEPAEGGHQKKLSLHLHAESGHHHILSPRLPSLPLASSIPGNAGDAENKG